jgi:hypothetical protein
MGKLLSFDEVLGASDRSYEDVMVKEWGGTVRLQGMSSAQRDQYEAEAYQANKKGGTEAFKNLRARLVAMCWVDEDGKPVATGKRVEQLGQKSAKVVNDLFDVCRRLNGLTEGDVEELEGN